MLANMALNVPENLVIEKGNTTLLLMSTLVIKFLHRPY